MKRINPMPENSSDSQLVAGAVRRLAVSNIGLCLCAALLCGAFCYFEIGGEMAEDFFAILIGFGVPCMVFVWFGISAGMIHLRKRFQLSPIPSRVHVVTFCSLVASVFWTNPIMRWWSIFLICSLISVTVAIRTAVGYQNR